MRFKFSLFFGLFFSTISTLFATHISGGEIVYKCLGGGKFEITLNLFRDCSGVTANSKEQVVITSPCGFNSTLDLDLQNINGTEISQLCTSQLPNSYCKGGTLPGMEIYTYSQTILLGAGCNSYDISWSSSARNTTLNLPSQPGIYLHATLNNQTFACDNSPIFSGQPIPYVCVGQQVNYNFAVSDADGDSLVYSFISAKENSTGTTISYVSGYSPTAPIPGVTLNSQTGLLVFTPQLIGNLVVVIEVKEYDPVTGVLKGTVMRDIQFVVQSCSNQVPNPASGTITGLAGTATQTGNYTLEMCNGSDFNFSATYTDVNVKDSLSYVTNIGAVLQGATVTKTSVGKNPLTLNFNWNPNSVTPGTYSFSVTVNDNGCPVAGIQTYVYTVKIFKSTFTGPDQVICGNQKAALSAVGGSVFNWSVISGDPIVVGTNFSCNPCSSPQAKPAITTVYKVTSNLTGSCKSADTVVVTVSADFAHTISTSPLSPCLGSPVQVTSVANPTGTYTYSWSPGTDISSTTSPNPLINPNKAGTYKYYVTVTGANGCQKKDSVTASFIASPSISLPASITQCANTNFTMPLVENNSYACKITTDACIGASKVSSFIGSGTATNSSTTYPAPYGNYYETSRQQYLFRASELLSAGVTGGRISSLAFSVSSITGTTVYNSYTIKMGCVSDTSLNNWETGLNTVFNPKKVTITTGTNTHILDNAYEWDGVSNIVVEICYDNSGTTYTSNSSSPYTTTTFQSALYYNSDTSPACGSSSSPSISNNRPNIKLSSCGTKANASYSYVWTPAINLSSGFIKTPVVDASNSFSQTYTVTVTDGLTGCSSVKSIAINVTGGLTDVVTASPSSVCLSSSSTIQLNAAVSPSGIYTYSWSPAQNLSSTTTANPVVSTTTAGVYKYYVTIKSSGGCIKTDSVSATFIPAPILSLPASSTISCGSTNFTMPLSVNANYTCQATSATCLGPSNLSSFVGTGAYTNSTSVYPAPYGNYYKTSRQQYLYRAKELLNAGVTGGKISALSFSVSAINGTSVYSSYTIKMRCVSDTSLSNWETGLYTVFNPKTVNVVTGLNTHVFDNAYEWDGVSNIVVEICFDNLSTTYTSNSSSPYTTTLYNSALYYNNDTSPACGSTSTPTVTSNRPNIRFTGCGTKTNSSYTYLWTPAINLSANNIMNPVVSTSTPFTQTYTVTVTSAGNCSTVSTITISNPVGVSATASVAQVATCAGGGKGAVTASATGGSNSYSYKWNTGATSATASNITPGTYTVTVTDKKGCSAVTTVTLTSPSTVVASAIQNIGATCGNSNGAATVSAAGGAGPYNYNWSTGATGETASNLSSGTYAVTVTDINSCTQTSTVTISGQPGPVINSINKIDAPCNGQTGNATVLASGGAGSLTYKWNSGASGQTSSGLAAGIYSVEVEDANGCTVQSMVTITEPPVFTVTSSEQKTCWLNSNTTLCNGYSTIAPTNGVGPFSYAWSDGQTSGTAVNLCVGNYTVTVTTANGCVANQAVTIGSSALAATTTSQNATCFASKNGSAAVIPVGTSPFSITWSGVTGTTTAVSNLKAGTYTVSVTDANNCTITSSIVITEPPAIVVTFASTPATCGTADGSATATISGGVTPFSYVWSSGPTASALTNITDGTYSLTVTDANACAVTSAVNVAAKSTVFAHYSVTPGCAERNDGTIQLHPQGGKGPYNFAWSSMTSKDSSLTGLQSGNYFVTITDAKSCSFATVIALTNNPTPIANAGPDETILVGNSTLLAGSGGVSFLWTPSDGLSCDTCAAITVSPETTTTYTLQVVDANTCSSVDKVTVVVEEICNDQNAIFIPNAFSPNGDGQNDFVQVHGSRCLHWFHFVIYNRWGEQVHESSNLSDQWDGTFRGTGLDMGVYTYFIKCEMDNGKKFTRMGNITLIR